MKVVQLKAVTRSVAGTRAVNRLRKHGVIPAILYGSDIRPRLLQVDGKIFERLVSHAHSQNMLLELEIEGEKVLAISREIQRNPITGRIIHIDFQRVVETEKIEVMVPIITTGIAIGQQAGGIVEIVLHQIRIRAKPLEIPEAIIVDITNLGLGQTLHVKDIKPPEGVEILTEPDVPVVSVVAPQVEEAETPAEAAVAVTEEPQVIKKGKEEQKEEE